MHASPALRRAAAALPEHPNLDEVVRRMNHYREWLTKPLIDLNDLTVADVAAIRTEIASLLSPEILHEDGEITAAQAIVKERVLRYALTELNQLVRRTVRV